MGDKKLTLNDQHTPISAPEPLPDQTSPFAPTTRIDSEKESRDTAGVSNKTREQVTRSSSIISVAIVTVSLGSGTYWLRDVFIGNSIDQSTESTTISIVNGDTTNLYYPPDKSSGGIEPESPSGKSDSSASYYQQLIAGLNGKSSVEFVVDVESFLHIPRVENVGRNSSLSLSSQFEGVLIDAINLREREELQEAAIQFIKSLRFATDNFGEKSVQVARVLNHFGPVFTGPGPAENQILRLQAFLIAAQIYFELEGPESRDAFSNLANAASPLRDSGDWAGAGALITELVVYYDGKPDQSLERGMIHQHYADVLDHKGDAEGAILEYQNAIHYLKQSVGLRDELYLDAKTNLSYLLRRSGKCQSAKEEFEEVRQILPEVEFGSKRHFQEALFFFSNLSC